MDAGHLANPGNDLFDQLGPAGIALTLITDVAWTACYVALIADARRTQRVALPMVALAVMWPFELCFAFIYPNESAVLEAIEVLWFILDTILVVQVFKFGVSQATTDFLKRNASFLILLSLLFGTAGMVTFTSYYQYLDGSVPGMWALCIIAYAFPVFIWGRQRAGQDVAVAPQAFRIIADVTSTAVVLGFFRFQSTYAAGLSSDDGISYNTPFNAFLLLSALVADIITLYLLFRPRSEPAANADSVPAQPPAALPRARRRTVVVHHPG